MDEKSKRYINVFYFIIFVVLIASFVMYSSPLSLGKGLGDRIESVPSPTLPQGKGAKDTIQEIKIKDKIYKVEIRDTVEGRNQGLSNTKHDYLCDSCALLFVWPNEGERIIWMKDMNYPIDMYWLNKDMQIVHSEYNVATSTYNKFNPRSSTIFGKGIYNAQYVLETLTH